MPWVTMVGRLNGNKVSLDTPKWIPLRLIIHSMHPSIPTFLLRWGFSSLEFHPLFNNPHSQKVLPFLQSESLTLLHFYCLGLSGQVDSTFLKGGLNIPEPTLGHMQC